MINKIREFRFALNYSQQKLANRCGVSRETINRIESGKSNPSLELAYRIARCLGVTIEELFVLDEGSILQ